MKRATLSWNVWAFSVWTLTFNGLCSIRSDDEHVLHLVDVNIEEMSSTLLSRAGCYPTPPVPALWRSSFRGWEPLRVSWPEHELALSIVQWVSDGCSVGGLLTAPAPFG